MLFYRDVKRSIAHKKSGRRSNEDEQNLFHPLFCCSKKAVNFGRHLKKWSVFDKVLND